jgi:hypothetical protein
MSKFVAALRSRVAHQIPLRPHATDAGDGGEDRGDGDDRDGDLPDELVPDPIVQAESNVSSMTIWRWDRDAALAALGWPPPVIIRKRKFRQRRALEAFKRAMVRRAIAARAVGGAAPATEA